MTVSHQAPYKPNPKGQSLRGYAVFRISIAPTFPVLLSMDRQEAVKLLQELQKLMEGLRDYKSVDKFNRDDLIHRRPGSEEG